MKTDCIEAVSNALGRRINPTEAEGIERRLLANMANIARNDPQAWAALGKAERYAAGAEQSAKQLLAEAQTRASRTGLNIVARAKLTSRFNDKVANGITGANSVERILSQTEAYISGIRHENFSNMMDAIDAAEPKFFGMIDNPQAVKDFIHEVFGEDSKNIVAKKGAQAWLKTIESMRQRFNRSGGDVGKLDYGYVPQTHDQATVLRAGQEAWATKIASKLDRSRYVDENGNQLPDAEFNNMLNEVWNTLSTGGLNKVDPNVQTFGTSLANRGSKSRQLHFKNADAWAAYNKEFGKGTLFEAMQSHVTGLSRNIGLVEELGPNAKLSFDMLQKLAIQKDGRIMSVGAAGTSLEAMYKVLTNENNHASNPTIAAINQGIRNITVATKLQGTLISSVTDLATLIKTTQYHQLPVFKTLGNVLKSFGKDYEHFANVNGLVTDSIITDMSRFADGNIAQGWTAKLAQTTMKLSLLNAWTDALKRGFQITMMGAIGKMHGKTWDELNASDRAKLKFQGITPKIHNVWQLAEPENWKGSNMLTPDSIRNIPDSALNALGNPERLRDEATAKLLGFIIDESEYAVVTPDLTTRASLGGGTQKGELSGELMRHLTLFKSFPLAIANRHIRRAASLNGETGSVGYGVSLMAGLIGFGALAVQLKSILNGQDPVDMNSAKFWGKATAQGGGLGIYGDLLYTGLGGQNRSGQANYSSVAGPVFGTAIDFANVTVGNLGESLRGEKTNAGAETVRFAKQNTPFINLWYAKSAIDHLLLQDLQESLSPGYLSKMKARAFRDFGQRYWWQPGDSIPDRAPDFAAATGN